MSDTQLLNPLVSSVTGGCFVLMRHSLGGLLDRGWSPERPSHDEKFGIFSFYFSHVREGRRAGEEVNNLSCLHNEASLKSLKSSVWRVCGV